MPALAFPAAARGDPIGCSTQVLQPLTHRTFAMPNAMTIELYADGRQMNRPCMFIACLAQPVAAVNGQ